MSIMIAIPDDCKPLEATGADGLRPREPDAGEEIRLSSLKRRLPRAIEAGSDDPSSTTLRSRIDRCSRRLRYNAFGLNLRDLHAHSHMARSAMP